MLGTSAQLPSRFAVLLSAAALEAVRDEVGSSLPSTRMSLPCRFPSLELEFQVRDLAGRRAVGSRSTSTTPSFRVVARAALRTLGVTGFGSEASVSRSYLPSA